MFTMLPTFSLREAINNGKWLQDLPFTGSQSQNQYIRSDINQIWSHQDIVIAWIAMNKPNFHQVWIPISQTMLLVIDGDWDDDCVAVWKDCGEGRWTLQGMFKELRSFSEARYKITSLAEERYQGCTTSDLVKHLQMSLNPQSAQISSFSCFLVI